MEPTHWCCTILVRYRGKCGGRGLVVSPAHPQPSDPPTPQDSLLAAPIMLDLALLTELCQRVSFTTNTDPEPQSFHPVLSLLSFLFKAPLVPPGSPVVNALFRQRSCIENILRCAGPRGSHPWPGYPLMGLCTGPGGWRLQRPPAWRFGPAEPSPVPQGLCGAPPTKPHAPGAQDGAPRPGHQASRFCGHHLPSSMQERTSAHCPQRLHRRCQWASTGRGTPDAHSLKLHLQTPSTSSPLRIHPF